MERQDPKYARAGEIEREFADFIGGDFIIDADNSVVPLSSGQTVDLRSGLKDSLTNGSERFAGLTPRQFEVLQLLSDGLIHQEIAERLSISAKTVEGHVSKIGDKGLVLSEELNESINRTRAGVVALIVEGIGNGELTHEWNGGEVTVSPREEQVIREVVLGKTNQEIAQDLGISRKTVEAHIAHIFPKLKVSNKYQLAGRYIKLEEQGLIAVGRKKRESKKDKSFAA